MSLGSELKETREAQGLSLDSLQETTKIQKRYLEAIEQGNYEILPGKFYARAFIKEYATAIGLDPNKLMEEYRDEIPNTEDDGPAPYSHMQRDRKDQGSQKSLKVFSVIPTIIVVLLVIGIIFFAWYMTQQSNKSDTEPEENQENNGEVIQHPGEGETNSEDENNDSDENDNNANSNEDDNNNEENDDTDSNENNDNDNEDNDEDEEEGEFSVVEEGSGNPPESEMDFKYKDDEATLKLDTDEDAWVEVKKESSEEASYNATLTEEESPEEIDVSDEDKVYLHIGNAQDMQVSINGEEMEYPVDKGTVNQKIQINLINDDD